MADDPGQSTGDSGAMRALIADVTAKQRHTAIATQMERQVDQALSEARDT